MNLKKYIVLSPIETECRDDAGYAYKKYTVKTTIVNGFTGDVTQHALSAKDKWDPLGNDADRLYFLPGCSVPRFKVREHFSVTIKPEYATACFVSAEGLEGSDNMFKHYKNLQLLKPSEFKPLMNDVKDYRSRELFFMLWQNNEIEGVFLDKNFWNNEAYSYDYFKTTRAAEHLVDSRYVHKHKQISPSFQLYTAEPSSKLGQINCDIYLEEAVLKHLNKNNLILSEEKYQELRSFGSTEDKENIVLMMELMSNCDFEKSLVYLLFLLKEFGPSIQDLKESNHVNFKSLLSFLKVNHSSLSSIGINDMTRILRTNNQFTRSNAMRLSMLFAGEHVDYSNNNNVCWSAGPVLKLDCETLLND
jgi:hypothetical protein